RIGELIEIAELVVVASRVCGELRGAAGVGRELFLNVLRIEQVQALREAGFLGALAFARARRLGPAEDDEEIGTAVEAVVRQRNRARARWQAGKTARCVRQLVDGVEEHLGGKTPWVVARKI